MINWAGDTDAIAHESLHSIDTDDIDTSIKQKQTTERIRYIQGPRDKMGDNSPWFRHDMLSFMPEMRYCMCVEHVNMIDGIDKTNTLPSLP
jgi:hypothetical protein